MKEIKKKKCPIHNDTRCYCDERKDFFKRDSKMRGVVKLKGHVHKETDFWATIHLPESGMIIDLMKKDLEPSKRNGVQP